jgi:hypothetical protein
MRAVDGAVHHTNHMALPGATSLHGQPRQVHVARNKDKKAKLAEILLLKYYQPTGIDALDRFSGAGLPGVFSANAKHRPDASQLASHRLSH